MTTRDEIPVCTCHLRLDSGFHSRTGTDRNVGCLRHPNAGSNSGQAYTAEKLAKATRPKRRTLRLGIANDNSQFFQDEHPERPIIWEHRSGKLEKK